MTAYEMRISDWSSDVCSSDLHPLYPLNKTLADFNMDVLNTYGATHDTQVIGAGQNSVEDTYAQVAAKHGRVVVTDNEPAKGYYYRSDQFELEIGRAAGRERVCQDV